MAALVGKARAFVVVRPHGQHHSLVVSNPVGRNIRTTTTTTTTRARTSSSSQLTMAFMEFLKGFQPKVTASHILIRDDSDETKERMLQWKEDIDNDPTKFEQYATEYSECSSKFQEGRLGSFNPGGQPEEFDEICFNEEVKKVHGPVKTRFGYHLIYIKERNDK